MQENDNNQAGRIRRLIPIPEFNKFHPDPTPSALRWMIFKNARGFRRCIVRRGHQVLIDEGEYLRWLDQQNQNDH